MTEQQQQPSPEQVKELQEKLKNMSPEELKEFQKKQCIFCHIIEGQVQSKKIYEDDRVLGILDINPANPGHVLLMPKEHYSIMPQIPADLLAHLTKTTKTISNALLKAVKAQGTNILIANGMAAGQKAQHFMMHIIPRKPKDGVNFTLPQNEHTDEELDPIHEKLSAAMGQPIKKEQAQETPQTVPPPPVVEGELKTPEPAKKPAGKKEGVDLDDIANLFGAK